VREAAADVADVLVDAEDLLYDEYDGQLVARGGPRMVDRQLAARDRDGGRAGGEAGAGGADHGAGMDRLHGQREAGGGDAREKAAAVEAGGGEQAVELAALVFGGVLRTAGGGLHRGGLLWGVVDMPRRDSALCPVVPRVERESGRVNDARPPRGPRELRGRREAASRCATDDSAP